MIPVQRATVDQNSQALNGDFVAAVQVSNRMTDVEQLVEGPGPETHFFHSRFQQRLCIGIKTAELTKLQFSAGWK